MARCRREEGDEHSSSTLPAVIAGLSFIYQFLAALACRHLSAGSPYVDQSISAYAWIGCIFSLLGLAGAVTHRSLYVTVFANFLLLDAFVSAACRVLLIHLFEDVLIGQDVCDAPVSNHDLVSEAYLESQTRKCLMGLRAVQIMFAMLMISATTAQGMLALAVRKHGMTLARDEWHSACALVKADFPEEKRRSKEEC